MRTDTSDIDRALATVWLGLARLTATRARVGQLDPAP
jgi:hypothetical protein